MKDYRKNELTWLAIFYAITFLLFCTDGIADLSQIRIDGNSLFVKLVEEVLISSIIPLFAFIVDSFITAEFKDRILGCFIIPRTGEKVFSIIKRGRFKDNRISNNSVNIYYKEIINNIPKEKKKKRQFENENWYKIYTHCKEERAVLQAQKDYLICRDMYIQTVSVLICYALAMATIESVHFSIKYSVLLLSMAIIINVAAHSKMKRFVYTVIVKDVTHEKKNKKT